MLAPNTVETHTVPANARIVMFSATDDFYINAFGAASIPVADVIDGTGSELNPLVRSVTGLTTFSLIAPNVTTITMAFYN